jgi:hypothetical protein
MSDYLENISSTSKPFLDLAMTACRRLLLGIQSLSTMKTVARPPATPITCNPYRPPVSSSALRMAVSTDSCQAPGQHGVYRGLAAG